jgi:hypothetical protein
MGPRGTAWLLRARDSVDCPSRHPAAIGDRSFPGVARAPRDQPALGSLYQEVSNSVGAGFDPGKGGCRGEHLCSATVSPVRANRDQLMRSMCWGGGWGNAARYWKAHRAEPGPFGLSANTSASVPAWCVAADLSDAKAAAGGHSFGMRGSTSSPNSRIDACASASAISLKLTCSEAISKSPIC